MKSIKFYKVLVMFLMASAALKAQDAVTISEGNFVRGTIQGTDFSTVILKNEDESISQFKAKDIKEFLWNGETYVSKPIVIKKRMEHRFFRLLEQGAVNLYSIGGSTGLIEEPQPKRARVRPSIGIGGGTGGFGGLGGGVGITIGGGRNREEQPSRIAGPTAYFIEKFGTGPMQEIPVEGGNSAGKNQQIKTALLQKMTNDEDLAERIKATESFDAKLVRSFVAAYNAMHK
ncbi:hypothetical protein ABIE26_003033 [Pedobacter africanus]|uniref:Uncharacterized protein n=1 Tax=Pedobacter africanus TaxID=151894 RepID=A0ACC6KX22_9SPHI|nr:hypothetical protein [Pedobacter africanus]MDR6783648.1 hypothetical protein [Pedobacter africanus]